MDKQTKFYANLINLIAHNMHAEIVAEGEAVIRELRNICCDSQVAHIISTEIGYIESIVAHAFNQLTFNI
jgi:hypothetical protein